MRKPWEQTLRDEAVSDAGGSVDSAPAAEPVSAPAESSQPEVDTAIFDQIASWTEPDEPVSLPAPAATATRPADTRPEHAEAKPQVPVAAPAAPVPAQPPTQPVAQPQQPAQQYQPQHPTQPQPPPPAAPQPQQWTPEQIASARQDVINRISPTFTFSEEQVIQLQTEPEKVLPTLAAQIFVAAYETLLPAVVQQIAPMVQNQIQTQHAQAQEENRFFERWPQLKEKMTSDPNARAEVLRIAQTYNRMNPQSDPGRWTEEVGAFASMRLGLPVAAPQLAAPAPPPAARPQPQRPFSPANPNGSAFGAPQAPPEENWFAQQVQTWEEEDRRM